MCPTDPAQPKYPLQPATSASGHTPQTACLPQANETIANTSSQSHNSLGLHCKSWVAAPQTGPWEGQTWAYHLSGSHSPFFLTSMLLKSHLLLFYLVVTRVLHYKGPVLMWS
jgi:hypothetical protein